MSNDRELLEMAAKAGGIEGEYVCWRVNGFKEGIRKPMDTALIPWNPITDDGPALRLAVKLNLTTVFHPELKQALVRQYHDRKREWVENEENHTDDYAATRRAIVRAAAEIGKSMP